MAWYLEGTGRFRSRVALPTDPDGEIVIRYNLKEGQTVVVRYDRIRRYHESPARSGRFLPAFFTCDVVVHDIPYTVTMGVSTAARTAPKLVSLGVSRRQSISVGAENSVQEYPAPTGITSEALRDVPVARVFKLAVLAATHTAPGPEGVPKVLPREAEISESYREAVRSAMAPRANPLGAPLDDSHYQAVAEIFKGARAMGDFPVQAVKDEWGVSIATANRYVREARNRGFLDEPKRRAR